MRGIWVGQVRPAPRPDRGRWGMDTWLWDRVLLGITAWQERWPSFKGHGQSERPWREQYPNLTVSPSNLWALPLVNLPRNQRKKGPTVAEHRIQVSGIRAKQRRVKSIWSQRTGTISLKKLYQGGSNLHLHYRQQHSTCKWWSACHAHSWKQLVVPVTTERLQLYQGSLSKTNTQMYLLNTYWTPIPWKTRHFTLACSLLC